MVIAGYHQVSDVLAGLELGTVLLQVTWPLERAAGSRAPRATPVPCRTGPEALPSGGTQSRGSHPIP